MDKDLFQVPVTLEKITTRADRTLKLEFGTNQELPDSSDLAKIMKQHQQSGWLVFSPSGVEQEDIPDIQLDTEIGETKSPSQRLRASLYRVWEGGSQKIPFEVWYRTKMERVIDFVKDKI